MKGKWHLKEACIGGVVTIMLILSAISANVPAEASNEAQPTPTPVLGVDGYPPPPDITRAADGEANPGASE